MTAVLAGVVCLCGSFRVAAPLEAARVVMRLAARVVALPGMGAAPAEPGP